VIGVETWSNLSWNPCAGVEIWNPCAGVKTGVVTVTISLGTDFAAEKEISHFDEVLASAVVHSAVRPGGQTAPGSSWNSIRIEKHLCEVGVWTVSEAFLRIPVAMKDIFAVHSAGQTSPETCFVGPPLPHDTCCGSAQRPTLLYCEGSSHLSVPHASACSGDSLRKAEGLCLVMKTW
jgi:hypothetical protein